jgi:hypothetical protein
MVVDMAHVRWRKKLLESRTPNKFYQMIGMNDVGVVDILFTYKEGAWHFKTDMVLPPIIISDVDEAVKFLIDVGVERYDAEFGI